MQVYELAKLTLKIGATPKAAEAINATVRGAGTLLGCWASDIGQLNEVYVLRGFDTAEALRAARADMLHATNPFGCAEWLTALSMDSYAPFPFVPPVVPGEYGKVYEIRTYKLKPGGLQPTIDAWAAAVPERIKMSHMVTVMYALDGAPRFTHIWPFASTNHRAETRAAAVEKGIWPPKGGPDNLTGDMVSTMCIPTAISPLR